ncbi:hypothetical protein I306_06534, partial [Cryptococcus gattii EJB2]
MKKPASLLLADPNSFVRILPLVRMEVNLLARIQRGPPPSSYTATFSIFRTNLRCSPSPPAFFCEMIFITPLIVLNYLFTSRSV